MLLIRKNIVLIPDFILSGIGRDLLCSNPKEWEGTIFYKLKFYRTSFSNKKTFETNKECLICKNPSCLTSFVFLTLFSLTILASIFIGLDGSMHDTSCILLQWFLLFVLLKCVPFMKSKCQWMNDEHISDDQNDVKKSLNCFSLNIYLMFW